MLNDRRPPVNYTHSVVAVKDLPNAITARMASLYLENFDGSSKSIFLEDLANKDEVILLFAGEDLVGFTTLHRYFSSHNGQSIRVVYSGDTIVDRAHWGQQKLSRAWITRIGEIKSENPDTPLYWLLLVKGHRTFKYLSVFGKSFFPHWSNTRSDLRDLATKLAMERFESAYDASRGIVVFPESRGHLKPHISEPSPEEMTKPATRYFLQVNPGFRMGHELVCVCELESTNMKPLAARIFFEAMQTNRTE